MMSRIVLVAALVACSTSTTHTVRFANAPAVVAVDDRHDTPDAPAARPFAKNLYHFRGQILRRAMRGLELQRSTRALGVNALDEVPDSTWFTNRVGARDVSLDEVRDGVVTVGSPEAHLPWTIKSTKVGGASVGFIITDARGEKFILKFDEKELPELETAADAITSRLLWTLGYNVAEDHVVYFRASDLVLAPDAKITDTFGNSRRLRQKDVEHLLDKISIGADGRIRGLASHFLKGKWLGGHPDEGVRADDPNDLVAHERRRDLRGARSIFAWLDHIDAKEDNTVDMWVTDPADPSRHYVKHYLIDFGKSLGVMAKSSLDPRRSYSYQFDVANIGRSLATLGFGERQWENRTAPNIRGVGLFDTATYSPDAWKPNSPSYLPFLLADDYDGFWGAKLVMRLSREQIRAAVGTGRFTDPRAADYIVDTLVERQKITARHYFSRVAPLDNVRIENGSLCFDDLMLAYELQRAAKITRYEITATDRANRTIASSVLPGHVAGRSCLAAPLSADPDGYTVVRIRTRRHAFDASTFVHLARKDGAIRVVGLYRE